MLSIFSFGKLAAYSPAVSCSKLVCLKIVVIVEVFLMKDTKEYDGLQFFIVFSEIASF